MTSQRQLEANRANAQLSTGPKSKRGKARAKLNAVTHGLTARHIIIPGEKPEQFYKLRDGLITDFAPGSTIERELIDALAGSLLRRRRVPVVEAALLKRLMGDTLDNNLDILTDEELGQLENISRRFLEYQRTLKLSDVVDRQDEASSKTEGLPTRFEMLTTLARHETSLMNNMIKTLNLLHILQARRVAAEERWRTLNATPSDGRLPVKTCTSSGRSPLG